MRSSMGFSVVVLAGAVFYGCSDVPGPLEPADPPVALAKGGNGGGGGGNNGPSDVNANWTIADPSGAAGLYSDGAGTYTHGQCGINSVIFVGNGSLGTDLNIGKAKGRNACGPRSYRLRFPDNTTETMGEGGRILVASLDPDSELGAQVGVVRIQSSRCGRILFGVGKLGVGVGTESLDVTRSTAANGNTVFAVTTKPEGNVAQCESEGADGFMTMHVSLTIEALGVVPDPS
jgi:hypothetical protein